MKQAMPIDTTVTIKKDPTTPATAGIQVWEPIGAGDGSRNICQDKIINEILPS